MPAKSKAQARFMYAAAEGKTDSDISPEKAKEYIKGVRLKGLPEHVPAKKSKKSSK